MCTQLTTYNLLLLFVLFSSCSVLKNKYSEKSDSLSRRDAATTERTSAVSSSKQQHVLQLSDSSGTDFFTEIIPEGEFHFSREGGFTGKASQIRIKGHSKSYLALKDSGSLSSNYSLNKETESKEKSLVQMGSALKAKDVKNNGPGTLGYWISTLLITGAVLFFVKKRQISWGKYMSIL